MKKIKSFILISVLFGVFFIGCGGSSDGSFNSTDTSNTLSGTFVDAPVSNIRYTAGTNEGYTDTNGTVSYESGETCTFYLGSLELGSSSCSEIMSPYTLAGDTDISYPSQKTKNIARILQSLDDTSTDSNKITINESMKNFTPPDGLDLNANIDSYMSSILSTANTLNSSGNYQDITEDVAVSNMQSYIEENYSTHLEISNPQPFQVEKIQADDKASGDYFGKSVAISGEYIVVGAYSEDAGGVSNAGSVYVFKKLANGSISQLAKLQANDKATNDYFGNTVAIDGDYIVVTANSDDTDGVSDTGSAYVFKRNSDSDISQIAKIVASDKEASDMFGKSVSISGDYIVVGSDNEDAGGVSNAGSAYVFKRNSDSNVSQIAKLQATTKVAEDYFGTGVSIDGKYIAVGANGTDVGGVAYLFKINSDTDVSQIAKFTSNEIEAGDNLGYHIAIDGDYIAVPAISDDTVGTDAGAMYLFKRNSDSTNDVTQLAKLTASDGVASDYLGSGVSIDKKYIIAGAADAGAGSAYVFKRKSDSNIVQVAKIEASDKQTGNGFGNSVSISGEDVVVGSYNEASLGSNTGAAYIYSLFPAEKP